MRYFATQEDADSNSNALPTLYTNTSNPQTIFTRINFNQTGCADVNSFQIEVLPAPESSTPIDIIICDSDQDGISLINLDNKIPEAVADSTNRIITFHNTQTDADNDLNAISDTSAYLAITSTIFIRIENMSTGCYSQRILKLL